MMAWLTCMGACVVCGKLFEFNPELVPSVLVNGRKEPVCRTCIETANPKRKAKGLPEIPILPGAYDPQEVP